MNAVISPCGQYRYVLTRDGDLTAQRGPAVFIMLNPSTADATLDDPTIRRCLGFAQSWGCDGIKVVNLYALRSTDPAGLWTHPSPIGPENDEWIMRVAAPAGEVVCAWGSNAKPERARVVAGMLAANGVRLKCLGTTKLTQAPRHPLYISGTQPLIDWSVDAAPAAPVAYCIGCGCHDFHACAGGCWWSRVDYSRKVGVCSQCKAHVAAWDAGQRTPIGEKR